MATKIKNELCFCCKKCGKEPKYIWVVGEIKPTYLCPECAKGK